MNSTDTNTANGIYLWDRNDTNWGIYVARSGAYLSLANGTACAIDNFSDYAVKFRAALSTVNGFIFENSNDELIMSINAQSKRLFINGDIDSSNLVGNFGNRMRYNLTEDSLLLQEQYSGSGTHIMLDFKIATTNVSGPVSRGRIEWNGSTMLYGNYSDRRLKTDIVQIEFFLIF